MLQEEEAAEKRAQFEAAKKEATQKVHEYEALRKEAEAEEGDVRDKSRLMEEKRHEVDDKKVTAAAARRHMPSHAGTSSESWCYLWKLRCRLGGQLDLQDLVHMQASNRCMHPTSVEPTSPCLPG